MAALPPRVARRRRRRGSPERPVNAQTYRGTWLLVGIPLLIAAFSVTRPDALPRGTLPPVFDTARAAALATELAETYPDRRPGSASAAAAERWVADHFRAVGLRPRVDGFTADVPGQGSTRLANVVADAPGRSPDSVVLLAHRDNTGRGPGVDDNASGTAALIEIARAYGNAPESTADTPARVVRPAHTIRFVSTDAGAFGWLGAQHFLDSVAREARIVAVVDLDAIAGRGRPGIQLASDRPRSAPAALVETAAARMVEGTGTSPELPGALAQLIDLGFPFSLYEHALFVGRGIPAITLTTAGARPPDPVADTSRRLNARRLGQIGRSTQGLLASLDQAVDVAPETSSYVDVGSRYVRGWAVQLVLVAALFPFLFATVDLFARCRRQRIPLAPALRSYRSRFLFWLFVGGCFGLFALMGIWGEDTVGPPPPDLPEVGDWPVLGLAGLATASALAWLLSRERLLPRRRITREEELAGATAALLALGVASLAVAAVNPFALVFVLPSLHAWLWIPQSRSRPWPLGAAVLAAGLAGPALLLASFAVRFRLGFDAPWYLLRLVAEGAVPIALVVAGLAWLAAAAQLTAITAGRYAPYPSASERRPGGPLRQLLRASVLAIARRRGAEQRARAA